MVGHDNGFNRACNHRGMACDNLFFRFAEKNLTGKKFNKWPLEKSLRFPIAFHSSNFLESTIYLRIANRCPS